MANIAHCTNCGRPYAPALGHICGTIVDKRFRCGKCNRAMGMSTVAKHEATCTGRKEKGNKEYRERAKRIKEAVMKAAKGVRG